MRKADYALLAQIINRHIKICRENTTGDVYFKNGITHCETIALAFADHASVNKQEFLRACSVIK